MVASAALLEVPLWTPAAVTSCPRSGAAEVPPKNAISPARRLHRHGGANGNRPAPPTRERFLMATVQDHHRPWCTDEHLPGDTDTQCRSDYEVIPDAVVLHDADTVPGGTAYITDDVLIALEVNAPGAPTRVLVNHGDDYLPLTLDGARVLAAALTAQADLAEAVAA